MTNLPKKFSVLFLSFFFLSCISKNTDGFSKDIIIKSLPQVQREFRAVWIATIWNLDWPSSSGLTKEKQIQEIINILDKLKKLKFNNIILQVRGAGDVIYKSQYEPWSVFLTGKQGKDPGYDPLKVWIKEAHKRNILVHAWINPFRASVKKIAFDKKSPVLREFSLKLPDGNYWINPASKSGKEYILNIIRELVKNYDLDGIHFDDYFYPYKVENSKEFPDEINYIEDTSIHGMNISVDDWRRKNIDKFIEDVYYLIKNIKPQVLFGISPFGIWQSGQPVGIVGTSSYSSTYSDSRKWLQMGYIDYLAPQLYWPIHKLPQSFPLLLSWWNKQNILGRNLYPGINLSSAYISDKEKIPEFNSEIFVSRAVLGGRSGNIFFRATNIINNTGGIFDNWQKTLFAKDSLTTLSPWLKQMDMDFPKNIKWSKKENSIKLMWSYKNKENIFKQVLYVYKQKSYWSYKILDSDIDEIYLDSEDGDEPSLVILCPVDRLGNIKINNILSL